MDYQKKDKGRFIIAVETEDGSTQYLKSYAYKEMGRIYSKEYKTYIYYTSKISEAKIWKYQTAIDRMLKYVFSKHISNDKNILKYYVKNITLQLLRKEKLDKIFEEEVVNV